MKRFLGLFLVVILLISTTSICYAGNPKKNHVDQQTLGQDVIEDTGISMTVDSFNQEYCGEPTQRKKINSDKGEKVDLKIKNLIIDNYIISFDAEIKNSDSTSSFSAKGELYDGYKREKGLNNYVGVLNDTTGQYDILLFEICNDETNQKTELLTEDKGAKQKPSLRFYLLDNNRNLYMFEIQLPQAIIGLSTARGEYTDSIHDALWFANIVKPIITEDVEPSPEDVAIFSDDMQKQNIRKANGSFSQYNFTSRTASYYVGSDLYKNYSMPYVKYKHLDVRPESTWILNFKVAEHVTINNVTYRSLRNVYRYKNVDLKVAAGGNTTFISTVRQGRMVDPLGGLKEAGSSISSYVLQKIIPLVPYMPNVTTVLGWFNTASQLQTITLGSSAVTLSGGYTAAVGMKTGTNYEIYECTDYDGQTDNGHYLYYQVRAQYEGTSGQVSSGTMGKMRVSFDTYNVSDYSSTPISKDFDLVYTASSN